MSGGFVFLLFFSLAEGAVLQLHCGRVRCTVSGNPGVTFFGVVGAPEKILSVSLHLLSVGSEREGQSPGGVAQWQGMGRGPVTPPAFL